MNCASLIGLSCAGTVTRSDSTPTCSMRPGNVYFATVVPGGFRYAASNESESGTSNVMRLPSIDSTVRSWVMTVPGLSHVCGLPLRVSVSMPMKRIQASVAGR